MSKQPPPAPTASTIDPCPTIIQISRTPQHWKFTQHLRTTRPPPPPPKTKENLPRKVDHTRIRAADGSVIETSGKLLISLQIDRKAYSQEFIVAKIQGIDGIIGMDFLYQFDGNIHIKKQILFTSRGKITLFQQNSNTCARIQLADTTVIPSNT